MDSKFTDQKEALAMAIEMEEKGHDFYQKTAAKAADNLTRGVFEFLAGEELKHIESIKVFYEAEMTGKTVDYDKVIKDSSSETAKNAIIKLFAGLEKKAPTDKPDLEAYKFARDFEKNGEKFYQEAAAKASDPQVKKLFSFLVEEEGRHWQMIDDSIAFLEDPGEWFHRMEKWHVEG